MLNYAHTMLGLPLVAAPLQAMPVVSPPRTRMTRPRLRHWLATLYTAVVYLRRVTQVSFDRLGFVPGFLVLIVAGGGLVAYNGKAPEDCPQHVMGVLCNRALLRCPPAYKSCLPLTCYISVAERSSIE